MKLPGADRAVVDTEKVRDHLLSDSHPVRKFKAVFFRSLGYSTGGWVQLAADPRRQAVEGEATIGQANNYGQKYEVRARIQGPGGRAAIVVAVWIVLQGEDFPRFVTAFPGART